MTRLDLLRRLAVVVTMVTPSFCVIMIDAWSEPGVVEAVAVVVCESRPGGLTCAGDELAGWRDGTCSGVGAGEWPLAQVEWVSPEKWTEKPRRAVVSTCRGTKLADGGR